MFERNADPIREMASSIARPSVHLPKFGDDDETISHPQPSTTKTADMRLLLPTYACSLVLNRYSLALLAENRFPLRNNPSEKLPAFMYAIGVRWTESPPRMSVYHTKQGEIRNEWIRYSRMY